MINLVSYFISSNTGLVELQNADFRAIVAPQVKIPSYYVFRKKILPEIMDKFYNIVNLKLLEATSISLITDIWTNRANVDFIALGASLTSETFKKEIIIINMMPMVGAHTAENIKKCIEEMINVFEFDKKNIHGKN